MTAAAEIAARLGGANRSGAWWRCRCPVHGSRGTTLALRDGDRGLIVHCHAGCSRNDVLAELRRIELIDDGRTDNRPPPLTDRGADRDDTGRRVALARRIWEAAGDARRSPVARYLAGRGITIAPPASIRWTPSLRRPDGACAPALVARIDSIDGEFIGISRTWLEHDPAGTWRRADRAMLGRAAGGAVRLAPVADALMIAEGIETAMAAMTATGMPSWAALSTSGMAGLALPISARRVVILADHDANGAGERAARAAATRWLGEGRAVRIAMPPKPGTDFADVLIGRAYAEVRNVAA